jgi:hypothetical protein
MLERAARKYSLKSHKYEVAHAAIYLVPFGGVPDRLLDVVIEI